MAIVTLGSLYEVVTSFMSAAKGLSDHDANDLVFKADELNLVLGDSVTNG